MRQPRLPGEVYSSQGPIPVYPTAGLIVREDSYGRVLYPQREIEIDDSCSSTVQILTLMHELVHIALFDSGVTALVSLEQEEIIADAIAQYFGGAIQAGYMKFTTPAVKGAK